MIKTLGMPLLAMAGAGAGELIQNHTMDLRTVCAVGAIVLTGTWTLSRRFTHLEDRIAGIEKDIHDLTCEVKARECAGNEKP
jgi:hypothetical protein